MSESAMGRIVSEETRQKLSESAKNRPPITEETRNKMSEMKKGINNPKTISKETVLNILELLNNGISVTEISKRVNVSNFAIYKIKKGGYDNIYDLPKKIK